jgi:transposase
MPNPYDVALRERAVKAYESGEGSYAQVAALFDLDMRTLERWVARWRATGTLEPKPRGGGWACPIDLTVLDAVVRERPDGKVDEFCAEYNRRVGRPQRTNSTSFRRAMRRQGFVVKKNARGRARSIAQTWQRSARRS